MPVSGDPNDTVPYVLELDRSKPDPKPTFYFRFLSARQRVNVAKELVAANESASKAEDGWLDKLVAVINTGLASRANVVTGNVDDVCSIAELWELGDAVLLAPRMEEADRKKRSAESTTAPVNSAKTADGAAA